MMNPIDIIQESVKEYKLSIAQARRDEIRKLLDYYTGTETEKILMITSLLMLLEKFLCTMLTLHAGLSIKCQEFTQ